MCPQSKGTCRSYGALSFFPRDSTNMSRRRRCGSDFVLREFFNRLLEKLREADADGGKTVERENGVTFHNSAIEIAAVLRAAMDFDPALDREDDPVFLHARLCVEGGEGAVFGGGSDGDLDDERGGGGMMRGEIHAAATNEGEVWLGFGVGQGQRFLFAQPETRRHLRAEQIV